MATLDQLSAALVKADAAGNADDARAFAAEIRKMRTSGQSAAPSEKKRSPIGDLRAEFEQKDISNIPGNTANIIAGGVRGSGSIGSTAFAPFDVIEDALKGKGLTLESNLQRRDAITGGLQQLGADPESPQFQFGKVSGEVLGTSGAGPALGIAAKTAGASPKVVQALTTGGFRTGAPAATTMGGKTADMALRIGAGTTVGGATAGLNNPEDAGTGALINGILPPATKLAGETGKAIYRTLKGPAAPQGTREAVEAARAAGYVIPPTQAKPSFVNKLLEGFSGKLTTAQNASAKNQPITNEMARKAIGAADLSEAGLAEVRRNANAAYTRLGNAGTMTTDDAFRAAIKDAGQRGEKFAADFPELVSKDADKLLEQFSAKGSFDAQSAIEAIKRLREGHRAGMNAFDDAEKKAFAKVQGKVADALEELVDRNLEKTGSTDLLASFREARQTLAKTYDVEKALNKVTENVDANKLAGMLKKGRLTGDLKTIASFAARFPKANQTVEKMGSLPQTSPLDWAAMAATSAATGNPLPMLGVLARPAARSLTLSGPVQNRLAGGPAGLLNFEPEALNMLTQGAYRLAPQAAGSR